MSWWTDFWTWRNNANEYSKDPSTSPFDSVVAAFSNDFSDKSNYEKIFRNNPGSLSFGNNVQSVVGNVYPWLNNALTGERDFNRQVSLQQMQQDFNSAEAAKAYQRQLNIAQNSTKWQAEQLRQLGVNPAWAIAGGGGSSPSIATAPTATSQAGSALSSGSQFGAAMSTLGQLVITAAKLAVLKK